MARKRCGGAGHGVAVGFIEADAGDAPNVFVAQPCQCPCADPACGGFLPGQVAMQGGRGDWGRAKAGLEQNGNAGAVGGGKQRGAVALVGVGVGAEGHGGAVAGGDVDVGEERGAVAAGEPGRLAEAKQGGVDPGRLEVGDEVVGTVPSALFVVLWLVGHAVEVGEAGEQAGCGGSECCDAGVVEQGRVAGDFCEDLGEAGRQAGGAAAEVHSSGDGAGFVEAGGLCRRGEEQEDQGAGDKAVDRRSGRDWSWARFTPPTRLARASFECIIRWAFRWHFYG